MAPVFHMVPIAYLYPVTGHLCPHLGSQIPGPADVGPCGTGAWASTDRACVSSLVAVACDTDSNDYFSSGTARFTLYYLPFLIPQPFVGS